MKKRLYLQVDDLLLVLLAVVFAPHVARVPLWISLFCFLSWSGAFVMRRTGMRPLPRMVVIVLALVCTAGAVLSFAGSLGREAGVGLLSLMLAIKPLEKRTNRDRMVTVFLAYFLILTNVLYSQSLVMAGYMIVCVVLASMIQIRINDVHGRTKEHLAKTCVLLGQALPLALVLFVLFPRLSGSLWGFQDSQAAGVTGLSDSMSPGRISALALSRAIAFRVSFAKNRIPPRESLYWRTLVLSRFDGRKWSQTDVQDLDLEKWEPEANDPVRYTVTAEPSDQTWMFALDFPIDAPLAVIYSRDLTLKAPAKISKRVRYPLVSCLDCPKRVAGDLDKMVDLPPHGGERAKDLALSWRKPGLFDRKIVDKALSYFRTNEFFYTLNPPLLAMDDPVDDFLFNVRKGYCEHYASAFTFLMRAAGIPARVVVGYQGGEMNPVGEYMIVRQSDAHAWSEVWLSDTGWTRIDPTAAVSPLRIEQGAEAVAAKEVGTVFKSPALGAVRWVVNHVRLNWDALNNVWNQWVLDYSAKRQKRLLELLGLARTWKGISTGIILSLMAVLGFGAGLLLYLGRPVRMAKDRVGVIYERFLKKTSAWPNEEGLPPVSYLSDLMNKIPDRAEEIGVIRDLYVTLRYRPVEDEYERDMQRFKERVRSFSVSIRRLPN
jgi:transglutaminase-like putative cysteine protease